MLKNYGWLHYNQAWSPHCFIVAELPQGAPTNKLPLLHRIFQYFECWQSSNTLTLEQRKMVNDLKISYHAVIGKAVQWLETTWSRPQHCLKWLDLYRTTPTDIAQRICISFLAFCCWGRSAYLLALHAVKPVTLLPREYYEESNTARSRMQGHWQGTTAFIDWYYACSIEGKLWFPFLDSAFDQSWSGKACKI